MIVKVEYILIFIVILLLCYNLLSSCGCGKGDGFSVGGQLDSNCDISQKEKCIINIKKMFPCNNLDVSDCDFQNAWPWDPPSDPSVHFSSYV